VTATETGTGQHVAVRHPRPVLLPQTTSERRIVRRHGASRMMPRHEYNEHAGGVIFSAHAHPPLFAAAESFSALISPKRFARHSHYGHIFVLLSATSRPFI